MSEATPMPLLAPFMSEGGGGCSFSEAKGSRSLHCLFALPPTTCASFSVFSSNGPRAVPAENTVHCTGATKDAFR